MDNTILINLTGPVFVIKASWVRYLGRKRIIISPSPVEAAAPAALSA